MDRDSERQHQRGDDEAPSHTPMTEPRIPTKNPNITSREKLTRFSSNMLFYKIIRYESWKVG